MSFEDRMLQELLESIERKTEKQDLDNNKLKRKGTGKQKDGDGVRSLIATTFGKLTPRKHHSHDGNVVEDDDVDNEKQCSSSSDTINQSNDTTTPSRGHNSCMSSTSSSPSTKSISTTSTLTPPHPTSSILPSEKSTIVTRIDCLEDVDGDWSVEKEHDGLNTLCYPGRTSLQNRFVRLEQLLQSIDEKEVDMDGTTHEEQDSLSTQVDEKQRDERTLKEIDRNQRGSDGGQQEIKTPANLSEDTNTKELAEECIKHKQRIGDEEEAPVPGNGRSRWLVVMIAVLLSLSGLCVALYRCCSCDDSIEYRVKSQSTSSSVLGDGYGNVQNDQVWPELLSEKDKKKGANFLVSLKNMRFDGSKSRMASPPLKSNTGVLSTSPSSSPLQPGKWLRRFWKLLEPTSIASSLSSEPVDSAVSVFWALSELESVAFPFPSHDASSSTSSGQLPQKQSIHADFEQSRLPCFWSSLFRPTQSKHECTFSHH